MIEIWKEIPGYEGMYHISTNGNIKRIAPARGTVVGYIFTPSEDNKGYLRTRLTNKEGKASTIKVHRIVAIAFIPNPLGLAQVNHKDGNKKNNCVDNLEWVTNNENKEHAVKNGLTAKAFLGKFGADHNRSIPIIGVNLITGERRLFHGAAEAAREIGSNIGSIWRVRKGIYHHTKNWTFEKL